MKSVHSSRPERPPSNPTAYFSTSFWWTINSAMVIQQTWLMMPRITLSVPGNFMSGQRRWPQEIMRTHFQPSGSFTLPTKLLVLLLYTTLPAISYVFAGGLTTQHQQPQPVPLWGAAPTGDKHRRPYGTGQRTPGTSQSNMSRKEPGGPVEEANNGVSFYTFTPWILLWDFVAEHRKELNQKQTRDCKFWMRRK